MRQWTQGGKPENKLYAEKQSAQELSERASPAHYSSSTKLSWRRNPVGKKKGRRKRRERRRTERKKSRRKEGGGQSEKVYSTNCSTRT